MPSNSSAKLVRMNPAARLHRVLKKATGIAQANFIDGWCTVFDIPPGALHLREREVVRMLGFMHDAVDDVSAGLAKTEIERETYESTLNRIRSAFSLQLVLANWEQVRAQLTQEAMGVFAFIAQVLPEEEAALDQAEILELKNEVEALIERVMKGELPEWAKAVLIAQLEIMRGAIREYPVRGAAAFREASIKAVVQWAPHQESMSEFANEPDVRATRALWPQIVRMGKRVLLINGFITSVLGTGKLGLDIIKETRQLTAGESHPTNSTEATATSDLEPYVSDIP